MKTPPEINIEIERLQEIVEDIEEGNANDYELDGYLIAKTRIKTLNWVLNNAS